MSVLLRRGGLERPAITFNFLVGGAGLGLLVASTFAWTPSTSSVHDVPTVVTFLGLFVFARLMRFEVPPNITASLIVPIQLAAIVLLDSVPTAWLVLPAFLVEVLVERPFRGLRGPRRRAVLAIVAFNLGMEALVTLAAGACWTRLAPGGAVKMTSEELLALVATFVVFKTVNEALMLVGHWLRGTAVSEYLAGARTTVLIETLTLPIAALMVLTRLIPHRTPFYVFVFTVLIAAIVVRGLTRTRAQLAAANVGLERKVREVETLARIGQAISADIELDSLLDTIHGRCRDILLANHFYIALYTAGEPHLHVAHEVIDSVPQEPKIIPLGEGLTSHVILSRQPLLVQDVDAELTTLPSAPLIADDPHNRSWLGVPMIARGEIVGAIVLQEEQPRAYDEDDLRVLSAIASQAAISVKNARLHREALHALRVEAENRQLRRLNAKKSEFVNMVAHQFRTPLTTVIGYTSLLAERVQKRGLDVPDLDRHLRTVHAESKRLADMVEELLNLSRIRAGRLPLTMQRFDLDQLVRETIASHDLVAAERSMTMVAETTHADGSKRDTPLEVHGDSNFIRQALANMIANALQYAPVGSCVRVRTTLQGEEATVSVIDEGPGVPPEDIERIFDEFYRAPGSTAERSGTGLGLSICRGIVEAHGGRTWAEARGTGTAFCFTLRQPGESASPAPRRDAAVTAASHLAAGEPA